LFYLNKAKDKGTIQPSQMSLETFDSHVLLKAVVATLLGYRNRYTQMSGTEIEALFPLNQETYTSLRRKIKLGKTFLIIEGATKKFMVRSRNGTSVVCLLTEEN